MCSTGNTQRYSANSLLSSSSSTENANYDTTESTETLAGCILWLLAADEQHEHGRYKLKKTACNHPCVVLRDNRKETDRVQICTLTSYSRTAFTSLSMEDRQQHVPIWPNNANSQSRPTQVYLQPQGLSLPQLRKPTWIVLKKSYNVPLSLLGSYDRMRDWYYYRLDGPSLNALLQIVPPLPTRRLSVVTDAEIADSLSQTGEGGSFTPEPLESPQPTTSTFLSPEAANGRNHSRSSSGSSHSQNSYSRSSVHRTESSMSSSSQSSYLDPWDFQRVCPPRPPGKSTSDRQVFSRLSRIIRWLCKTLLPGVKYNRYQPVCTRPGHLALFDR